MNREQLLEAALRKATTELSNWHGWQFETNPDYRDSSGALTCQRIIKQANEALAKSEGAP